MIRDLKNNKGIKGWIQNNRMNECVKEIND